MAKTAFIFGAGSSRGTLGEKLGPVAKEFGRRLADFPPDHFPALYKVAEHLGRPISELTLEDLWTCVDYHAKFEAMLPEAPPWGWDGSRNLKKALLRVYGRACDQAAEELLSKGDCTLRDVLKQARPGDTIISFNYDTLVERLARRFGYDLRYFHHELRRDVFNFAKPHGSTAWCLDFNTRTVAYAHSDGAPLLESLSESEVERNREPLVLGAVPIKSEILYQVQHCFQLDEVFNVVARQWRGAMKALGEVEQLIVVGYSFPKEDHYGRFLFKEAARLRSTDLAIECYERESEWCRVKRSIEDTFAGKTASPKRIDEVRPPKKP